MNCSYCEANKHTYNGCDSNCFTERYDAKKQDIAVLKEVFMCADYGLWAVQGFASIEKANIMFMSFAANHKANAKIACFTVDIGAKTCSETKTFTFDCDENAGQPNCLASVKVDTNKYAVLWSDNNYTDTVYYVIYDASWNTFSEIKMYKGNHVFYNVFSYSDTLQCYGRNNNKLCVFDFVYKYTNGTLTIMPFVATYLESIPSSIVRTPQGFTGDGQYYYFLTSNPNCIAVYNLNGGIERWINIGEWAQKTLFIGELEGMTFYSGKWYVNTQFYHAKPRVDYDTNALNRFWCVWEIDFSESCANGYPHYVYSKDVYTANIDPNLRETICYQDGSTEHPFGCFDIAFYCGLNPAYYNVNICYKANSIETVKNVYKTDNKEYNIQCDGSNITFKSVQIYGGTLKVNSGSIESCSVGSRGVIMLDNCNFTNGDNESYSFNGGVFITNGNHTVDDYENTINTIKINSGCYGVIDFVESEHNISSNENDRTNLRIRGVINGGRANNWLSIYTKSENPYQIGDTLCEVKTNRTIIVVCNSNGNIITKSIDIVGSGFYQINFVTGQTNVVIRTIQFFYNSKTCNLKIDSISERTIGAEITINTLTSGEEPDYFTVEEILTNGFN